MVGRLARMATRVWLMLRKLDRFRTYPSVVLASAIFALAVSGCGGGGGAPVGGCGGVLKGAKVQVDYPARSLPSSINNTLSSALSGSLLIKGAKPGGGDLTIAFNRDPGTAAAHTETYNMPDISTGTFNASVTLYAAANQAGAVVGSASAQNVVDCVGQTLRSVSLSANIKSVVVTPLTLTVGGGTGQLVFTAKDSASNPVVISPGSAIFKGVGGAATVSADGIVTPISGGTIQVTATVDGVTSAAATVTINNASVLPHYHLTEIKPNTSVTNSVQIAGMNSSGLVAGAEKTSSTSATGLVWSKTAGATYVGNYCISVDDSNGVLAENVDAYGNITATYYYANAGTAGGVKYPDGGNGYVPSFVFGNGSAAGWHQYWSGPTSQPQTLVPPTGNVQFSPVAANSSGLIVGYGSDANGSYGIYWPTPASTGVQLQGALGFPSAVSSDGRMVGNKGGAQDMYYWASGAAAPTLISINNVTLLPSGVNNKGMYCGTAQDNANGYPFVGNLASGPVNIATLLDATSTGWTLYRAYAINDAGWIVGDGLDPQGRSAGFLAIPL